MLQLPSEFKSREVYPYMAVEAGREATLKPFTKPEASPSSSAKVGGSAGSESGCSEREKSTNKSTKALTSKTSGQVVANKRLLVTPKKMSLKEATSTVHTASSAKRKLCVTDFEPFQMPPGIQFLLEAD